MQGESKEVPKITRKREKGINMDIIINTGLENIYFQMNQDEIEKEVGIPDDVIISSEGVIEMHYDSKGVTFFIHDDYISIHSNRILIDNVEVKVGVTEYSELIPLVRSYHDKRRKEYVANVEDDEDEKTIFFSNIGLTIWLEDSIVNDISVESIDTNEEE